MLQKLAQARQSGVACIVAAGNSGDAVQFPGVSPDVLTVAAIGKLGEFPADSFHARQVPADGPIDKGYFSATFSLPRTRGRRVRTWSRCRLLCATRRLRCMGRHFNGHPAHNGARRARSGSSSRSRRFRQGHRGSVDRLFQIIKASATPLNLGDPGRTGAGVPDAVRAVTGQPPPTSAISPEVITALLEQLHQQFVAARLLSS